MSKPNRSDIPASAQDPLSANDSYADELSRLDAQEDEDVLSQASADDLLARSGENGADPAPSETSQDRNLISEPGVAVDPASPAGRAAPGSDPQSQETGNPGDNENPDIPGMDAPSPPADAYADGDPARANREAVYTFTELCRKDTTPAGKLHVMLETLRHAIHHQELDAGLKTQHALKEYLRSFAPPSPSLGLTPQDYQQTVAGVQTLEHLLRNEDFMSAWHLSQKFAAPAADLLKPTAPLSEEAFRENVGHLLPLYQDLFAATAQQITQDRQSRLRNIDGRMDAVAKAEEKVASTAQGNAGGGGFSFNLDFGRGNKAGAGQVSPGALSSFLQRRQQNKLVNQLMQESSPQAQGIQEDIQACQQLVHDINNATRVVREHKQTKRHFDQLDRALHDPGTTPGQVRNLRRELKHIIENEQANPHSHLARQQKAIGTHVDRLNDRLDALNGKLRDNPSLAKDKRQDIHALKGMMDDMMHRVTGGDDGIDKSHPDDRGKLGKLMEKIQAMMERVSHLVEKLAKVVTSRLSAG